MTKTELEKILNDTFTKVKTKFGYIPLKHVKWSNEVPTAAIDMGNFEIKVNQEFIQKMDLPLEDALEAVLDHEVGHYVFHPFNLKRVIKEHQAMKEKENGENVRQFYDDVNNNLRVIMSQPETQIPSVYKALKPESKVEKILLNLYQGMTGKDFGAETDLPDELVVAVEQLKTINFLNYDPETEKVEFVKQSQRLNIKHLNKFYQIIAPFYEQDKQEGNTPQNIMGGSPQLGDYDGKQIRKSLKEMVAEGEMSPTEAKELLDEVKDKMGDGGHPGGKYLDNPDKFGDRFVYESLATKYRIVLKKTPLISSDGMYPTRNEKFEVGDSVQDLDPFNSYGGRILPGLSNKWVKETVKYHGKKEATPDLMIILDDSGSMPNPTEKISNAVLSSFVIAREYLNNSAKVGVARFSDRTTPQEFTKDKHKVLNELLSFKCGGATQIDLPKIKTLAESNGVHDYILITDGQISNYNQVIGFLNNEAKKGARAYLVKIGMDEKTHYDDKVKVFGVDESDDIGKIILDQIHKK